ncbi:MAG: response regulator [Flavobacteriales bacterium]|nr:response regulator [Flavobacteriales bacterium]
MSSKLNIILVDDNDIDIVVNTKLLKLANITDNVTSFSSCDETMSYFMENSERIKENVNVVLLDIQMPGTDGFQCLEKFAAMSEDLKSSFRIFMLSSSIDRGDIEKAEANPDVIKVLEKPLDVYLLKRLISATSES